MFVGGDRCEMLGAQPRRDRPRVTNHPLATRLSSWTYCPRQQLRSLLPVPTAGTPFRFADCRFGFKHGYAKLARGPDDFVNILHAIGVPGALLAAGQLSLSKSSEAPHLPGVYSSRDDTNGHRPARSDSHGISRTIQLIKLQSFDVAGAHFGRWYETDLLYLSALSRCVWEPVHVRIDGL